jgi:hypothetical protein
MPAPEPDLFVWQPIDWAGPDRHSKRQGTALYSDPMHLLEKQEEENNNIDSNCGVDTPIKIKNNTVDG